MKKELTNPEPEKNVGSKSNSITIKTILDSNYILLPDGTVARLLTPTKKHQKCYYNLSIKGKLEQWSVDDLREIAK